MDTKEEAEEASGSFAVPVGSRFAESRERKVVYRPGFPKTYHGGGCVKVAMNIIAGIAVGLMLCWIGYKLRGG
jgi:hypothetical protein